MHDEYCKEVIRKNINKTVSWYLMASFAYYQMDKPIISDVTYDMLGRMMLDSWKEIEYPHKKLIREADLRAGTFLLHPERYPAMVRGALADLKKQETKPDA